MSALLDTVDPDGLLEYSVVFTDRSLNHMSQRFQGVMRDLSAILRRAYNADGVAIVPGGGSYAMEAVARQFAGGEDVLVIRNGWFSYRWTQILEAGAFARSHDALLARRDGNHAQSPFRPHPLDDAVSRIRAEKPAVVFAPHVETSAGMILPDDYIEAIAAAVHGYGGLLVLDSVASGCAWVDMKARGVDVLISAPQKGWSASPSAGLVMMSERALAAAKSRKSSSFAADLGKWLSIMEAYENGGHAYHATMPTDALAAFRDTALEMEAFGFEALRDAQFALGQKVRAVLAERGFQSVAHRDYGAPGVVVSYTTDPEIATGKAFVAEGMQVAAGVPLQVGEGDDYRAFRVGLFGIDKLKDTDAAAQRFAETLDRVMAARKAASAA